jgi:hypothetical protein
MEFIVDRMEIDFFILAFFRGNSSYFGDFYHYNQREFDKRVERKRLEGIT